MLSPASDSGSCYIPISLSPVSRVTGGLTINSGGLWKLHASKSFALHDPVVPRSLFDPRPRQLLIHRCRYVCTEYGVCMYLSGFFLALVSVFVDFVHPNLLLAFRRLPPLCASKFECVSPPSR